MAGFGIAELKDAGFTAMHDAGFSAQEMIEAGESLHQLKHFGFR